MKALRMGSLLAADARNIVRDPLLLMCAALPVVIAGLLRAAWPLAQRWSPIEIDSTAPLLGTFAALATPMLFGWIAGFLILDERDQHILEYVSVTPLGRRGLLRARLGVPVLASVLVAPMAGLIAPNTWSTPGLIAVSVIASIECPVLAIALASTARNKVEGLAIAKLASLPFVAVPAAFYLGDWAWLFAWLPPFWVAKLAIDLTVFHVVGAVIVHSIWLAGALYAFSRTRLA